MWNPATQTNNSKTPEPVKAAAVTTPVNFEPPPATGPRGVTTNHQQEQATIGKSLVVKGEVTGSESLYVDGRVEGTINLPRNRAPSARTGQLHPDITPPATVALAPRT